MKSISNTLIKELVLQIVKVSLTKQKFIKGKSEIVIFLGSLWITNHNDFRKTNIDHTSFSNLEPTLDILSLSLMTQHNHNEILEQRKRLDFISTNLNVLIASVSVVGSIEFQNHSFNSFKRQLPNKGKDFVNELIQFGLENKNSIKTLVHKHIDGKFYEFHITIKDNSILFVAQDVSEKKAYENAKKEKKQAIQRAQFIHQFLSNMSHEIRTPLNGIIGMLDAMSDMNLNNEQNNTLKFAKERSFS